MFTAREKKSFENEINKVNNGNTRRKLEEGMKVLNRSMMMKPQKLAMARLFINGIIPNVVTLKQHINAQGILMRTSPVRPKKKSSANNNTNNRHTKPINIPRKKN